MCSNIQFYGWLGNLLVASIGAVLRAVDLAERQRTRHIRSLELVDRDGA